MVAMKSLCLLLTPSLALSALLSPPSNGQKSGHVTAIRQLSDEGGYGDIISRGNNGIPPDDSDIEPTYMYKGKLTGAPRDNESEAYEYLKKKYPGLKNGGWYYGMLCSRPEHIDNSRDTKISKAVQEYVMSQTGGCTHVFLLYGKYNATRQGFVGTVVHVKQVVNRSYDAFEWYVSRVRWWPKPEQDLDTFYETTREKARSPRIFQYADEWAER
ncbi:hypothetical protein LX36DRAFT_239484 [Colletotrichum falcatum]|nr:hypothetical protein LX36DRAFT_239484 [Colletotrichum falcatum]